MSLQRAVGMAPDDTRAAVKPRSAPADSCDDRRDPAGRAMRRILFVDDEVGVLEALRDALAGRGDEWDMRLARDAPAAVQALGSETFDVVASDLRLPGVTGAELLARVQASCPEAVRVILCDEHDMRGALREAPAAHAFVTKPCDPGALAAVVERACLLRE